MSVVAWQEASYVALFQLHFHCPHEIKQKQKNKKRRRQRPWHILQNYSEYFVMWHTCFCLQFFFQENKWKQLQMFDPGKSVAKAKLNCHVTKYSTLHKSWHIFAACARDFAACHCHFHKQARDEVGLAQCVLSVNEKSEQERNWCRVATSQEEMNDHDYTFCTQPSLSATKSNLASLIKHFQYTMYSQTRMT